MSLKSMKFLRKLYKFRPDGKLYPCFALSAQLKNANNKKEVEPRQHDISQLHWNPGGAIATPDGGELDAGSTVEETEKPQNLPLCFYHLLHRLGALGNLSCRTYIVTVEKSHTINYIVKNNEQIGQYNW